MQYMERELILSLKRNTGNRERLNAEISVFKKILPAVESFQTFQCTHEFFDLKKSSIITNARKQLNMYHSGLEAATRYFAICKN